MANSSKNKIALLLPCLKFGGAERVALNLAKALRDSDAQVEILLMSKEGEFLEDAKTHFNVVDLKCNRTYKLPGKLLAYMWRERPNVLLSSFWKLNLCACAVKFLSPRHVLLLWEHSEPSKSKNSPKWLYAISSSVFYQLSDNIIAVSSGVHGDISRWTFGLQRKLKTIFNPIRPPDPNLLLERRQSREKQILWVGRLDDVKNPGLLLEAFALMPMESNTTLLFVGDGKLRAGLEKRCRDLGLEDRVRFHGYHPNPYELMASSDLLVLSSNREGLPGVIIEAMYCGLRVVSTDCGKGIRDILLDGHYGTIVPPGDKFALAAAVETELQTPLAAEKQIRGAQRFLPHVIAEKFIAAMR
jgi:glycosyltransferase involved in cell wall biosynthesis